MIFGEVAKKFGVTRKSKKTPRSMLSIMAGACFESGCPSTGIEPSIGRIGRAELKTSGASEISVMNLCGMSSNITGGAITAKARSRVPLSACQAFRVISGPIPAGSPMLSARGRMGLRSNGRRAWLGGANHAGRVWMLVRVAGQVIRLRFDHVLGCQSQLLLCRRP